jgi:hypothetical protein
MLRKLLSALLLLPAAAMAASPVAHVYVQTTKGVNLYNVAFNGQLSLASGSPFKTVGLMVGTNGKFFFSNGTTYIHVYAMTSTGAIGKEVAKINTAFYAGSQCGTTAATFLDHTGQYIYVDLTGPSDAGLACDEIQSYKVNSSSGQLTFLGGSGEDDLGRIEGAPHSFTVTGGNTFVYAIQDQGYGTPVLIGFHRESSGALDRWGFTKNDPPTFDSTWGWLQSAVTADPSNHLATVSLQEQYEPMGPYSAAQLASYTVDSQGNVSTTNTYQTMLTPYIYPTSLNMSPSGKLLAAAGYASSPGDTNQPPQHSGLQVFHFNGASPITTYSGLLTGDPINFIHWDNANHLFALGSGKLYVYTVTPTSIKNVPGSPYKISNLSSPSALIVR